MTLAGRCMGAVVNDYKGNVEVVGNVIDNNDLLIS